MHAPLRMTTYFREYGTCLCHHVINCMTMKIRQDSQKCLLFRSFKRISYRILTVILFLIIVTHASVDLDISYICAACNITFIQLDWAHWYKYGNGCCTYTVEETWSWQKLIYEITFSVLVSDIIVGP